MTTEAPREAPTLTGPWPVLDVQERRLLGVLIEKQKTTPDAYPLSLNALLTGSNQKSNRDPLLELTDDEIEDALVRCQKGGLVMKITGGRVERWRHLLYDAWRVGKVELAVLAELLLRGPQTEGELRTRVSRMEPVDDLDALREVLRPLKERGLIVYLTPEERRGTVLTHGFHAPAELEQLRSQHRGAAVAPSRSSPAAPSSPAPAPAAVDGRIPALEAELSAACGEISALKEQVSQLQTAVQELGVRVGQLEQGLGM